MRGHASGSDAKVMPAPLSQTLTTLMVLTLADRFMCADGPDLRKCRPKTEKAASGPARTRPRPIPLASLGSQPGVAAPAPRVPAAAAADLPMVFVEAVAATAGAHAHVVVQAVE